MTTFLAKGSMLILQTCCTEPPTTYTSDYSGYFSCNLDLCTNGMISFLLACSASLNQAKIKEKLTVVNGFSSINTLALPTRLKRSLNWTVCQCQAYMPHRHR